MSLSTKLGLSVLVGLLALVGALGYLGLQAVWQSTDRTMEERLVLAGLVAQDIQQDISLRLQELERVAPPIGQDLEARDLESVQMRLEEIQRHGGPYAQATFLLDRQRQVVAVAPAAAVPQIGRPASDAGVARSLYSGLPGVSTAPAGSDNEYVVSLSVPVRSAGGDILGVLSAALGPASGFLQELLGASNLGETGYAQVINEEGQAIAASRPSPQAAAFPVTAHVDRFTGLIERGESGVWTCHRCHDPEGEGERRQDVMAFAPLSSVPWGVAIRQDEGEAFAPRDDLQRKFIISGSVALALALTAAVFIGRTLSRPLRRLTVGAQRIAAGNLEQPIAVPGRDEIGRLGAAFEEMRERLRDSRRELEERSRALATLEERDRIAREMHDSLSQVLSYLRFTARAIRERLAGGDLATARDKLDEIERVSLDAYEDVRQGILALRAGEALDKGLLPALREYLDHYRARTGLALHLSEPEGEVRLSQAARVQVLRIVQEALANVRKHAQASSAAVEFACRNGWVEVSVADDGRGFDPEQVAGQRFGLQIMRERAESVGGALEVTSRPGAGTRVTLRVPCADPEKGE